MCVLIENDSPLSQPNGTRTQAKTERRLVAPPLTRPPPSVLHLGPSLTVQRRSTRSKNHAHPPGPSNPISPFITSPAHRQRITEAETQYAGGARRLRALAIRALDARMSDATLLPCRCMNLFMLASLIMDFREDVRDANGAPA